MKQDYHVSKTDNGEVWVYQRGGFSACYINKQWLPGCHFNAYEMHELIRVKDDDERLMWWNLANLAMPNT
jgi:hypothetical protein